LTAPEEDLPGGWIDSGESVDSVGLEGMGFLQNGQIYIFRLQRPTLRAAAQTV
jgi:hypothetical protein